MWLGKVALILYVFSFALMWSGYYLDLAFGMNLFQSYTYDALAEIMGKNTVDETISTDLIFGDFLAGAKVVFGVFTFDTVTGALKGIPNIPEVWMILIGWIFGISSVALWVYIIASRSL